jgi:outer membrane protein OmpA-like peptidoglycan-associated protein
MKKIYIILFLTLAGGMVVQAQNRNTRKADQHFDRLEYVKAAEEYEKLVERNRADAYVYRQLATSYYLINNTEKAEPYFREIASETDDPEVIYSFAQTLKSNGKAEESNRWMKKFAELAPSDSRAIEFKNNPNYIPKLLEKGERYKADLIGELASEYTDFGGTILNGEFYFTSSRNTSRKSHGMTGEAFLDIYKATYTDGIITDVNVLKGDVNTKYHEAIVSFSPDGTRMYFDRNAFYKGKFKKDEEGVNQLNIFYATLIDGTWKDVQPVPFNNTEYSVGHPSVSPDGKYLYFVSDMPGGFGDSDIYRVSINSDGSFGEPENLGRGINTEGKEVFPSVDSDGVLYFSSNGHLGLGGLDVFYAEAQGNGFGEVTNIGSPVNSSKDDFAYKYYPDLEIGFVSSNRSGNVDNIYRVEPVCSAVIHSIVRSEATNEPLSGAVVTLYDANENRLASKNTGADGKVEFTVECDNKYVLQAAKGEYETNSGHTETRTSQAPNVEIKLRPIEKIIKEDRVVLNPILFDFDRYNIKPQAAFELDKLVELMKKYPNMIIKVEGHTDTQGNAEYNMELSKKRTQATVQYVISQGIDESRISGEGFGESRPVVDCGSDCTEEDHAKNRRSEFIIVKR